MKKIFSIILIMIMSAFCADAKSLNRDFNTIIHESGISANTVSISIKDASNGKKIYTLNDKILMHPASVQKMITIVPIAQTLGDDFNFETKIYSRGKDSYVIKLGADPYLQTKDLNNLVQKINPETVKQVYIDDTIIEQKDWGEGWQWDDDLNILMPRFNAYNLDSNLFKLTVMPTEPQKAALIINQNKGPVAVFNNVITSNKNEISVKRNNAISSNTIIMEGTVKTPVVITVPSNDLKLYFSIKLKDSLEDNKIYLKNAYKNSKLSVSDNFLTETSHPLSLAIEDVLKNSNNMVIETMAKIAAGKMYNKQGTDEDGTKLVFNYLKNLGIDCTDIRIVDASGVSKNNLSNTDFLTEFLIKNKDNKILSEMAYPGVGTLENRMLPLKDNLKAKTGTLSDTSSIAGFLTSKKGKNYVFAIMINNPSTTSSEKKALEDYLIRCMYLNL